MISLDLTKKLQSTAGEMILRLQIEIQQNAFITLYGESGAGKTSALRMIAGLMKPDQGEILVNGKTWFSSPKRINLTPQERGAGMLFQNYSLFPNMTVAENIRYAGADRGETAELVEFLGFENLQDRYPESLSGGQQQRVALARALAQKPQLLLLDEPLSALDETTRFELQQMIRDLHDKYGLTTILVSHDHSEMIRLSDKVYWIKDGSVVKEGKPSEVLVNDKISGKFQVTGTIIDIKKQDFISILFISTGNDLIKVIADTVKEHFAVGEKVLVSSKAFNPMVTKTEGNSH